ncbi:MAG: amidophosphoribosyltransferase [Spirochaetaceae bacterium]
MNRRDDKLREECGVFAVFTPGQGTEHHENLSRLVYYGLYAQQHRGQESAGMALLRGREFELHRGLGLVAEVFTDAVLAQLQGSAAVGHVRYSTSGSNTLVNAQPLVGQSKIGPLAIAHNGNLVNAPVIRELLEDAGVMFQSTSDSEVILNLIARGAKYGLERALWDMVRAIQGAFSIALLTQESLIAIRDPYGIRPLVIGRREESYVVASETCALDAVGAELLRDVEPGEIVVIDDEGMRSLQQSEKTHSNTCSFEFIYFSRPDSRIDGVDVYASRTRAGKRLYEESPVEADLVSGVPDSGVVAAMGYAEASGIPYGQTLIKNKYVGRSFIAPSQELRERAVQVKLNVLRSTVDGKRIILIDDSIVRGTTSRRLVSMLRRAGAREVHFRVASPPVRFPCYFGLDTPTRNELAGSRSLEEIRQMIGADTLAYLSTEGLLASIGRPRSFCTGCFTGVYPVAAPMEQEKLSMERKR